MKALLLIVVFLVAGIAYANTEIARSAVHIIDYIDKDYPQAVQDGKILNPSEFQEQIDFADTLVENVSRFASGTEINHMALGLRREIAKKSQAVAISGLCHRLKLEIIVHFGLRVSPSVWPNLNQGAKVYAQNCTGCHGSQGNGLGTLAKELNPSPTNFTDPIVMRASSPFSAFNTIRLGIPNTAMSPFRSLSDDDTWAVAFYITSLRHLVHSGVTMDLMRISLEDVASLTDEELGAKYFGASSHRGEDISAVRLFTISDAPAFLLSTVEPRLKEVLSLYDKKQISKAQAEVANIYLEVFEPMEPRIRSTSPSLVAKIEHDIAATRQALAGNSSEAVTSAIANLQNSIKDINSALGSSRLTPTMSFISALSILLREGFEAVLVILALMSVLRGIGSRTGQWWVHGGWLSAVLVGLVFWFLSGKLIELSGAQREGLEAFVSLVAVVVLLYMGFWLHSQTEVNRWKLFLGTETRRIMETKKLMGLFSISFIAVFREAFESVLFLRAIWIETDSQYQIAVTGGVLVAFLLVIFLAWALLHYSEKVPLRTLFTITSGTIAALAVVLMGKGIHALQETAMMRVSALPFDFRIDLLGIYPSWECIGAQIGIGLVSLLLWKLGSRPALA